MSPLSPCRDAGNPDPAYYDPDGSVADIGALYFDGRTPCPYNLSVLNEDHTHVLTSTPEFSWAFYGIEQEGFELEIGSDNDWGVAETWAPGQFVSSDTSVLYAGPLLTDGATYYYRLRLVDSAGFGPWQGGVFRMNSVSASPPPHFPLAGDSTSVLGVVLYAVNSPDGENDDQTYDFELYNDPGLADLETTVHRTPGAAVFNPVGEDPRFDGRRDLLLAGEDLRRLRVFRLVGAAGVYSPRSDGAPGSFCVHDSAGGD